MDKIKVGDTVRLSLSLEVRVSFDSEYTRLRATQVEGIVLHRHYDTLRVWLKFVDNVELNEVLRSFNVVIRDAGEVELIRRVGVDDKEEFLTHPERELREIALTL